MPVSLRCRCRWENACLTVLTAVCLRGCSACSKSGCQERLQGLSGVAVRERRGSESAEAIAMHRHAAFTSACSFAKFRRPHALGSRVRGDVDQTKQSWMVPECLKAQLCQCESNALSKADHSRHFLTAAQNNVRSRRVRIGCLRRGCFLFGTPHVHGLRGCGRTQEVRS